jgi:hypothetical protein
MNDRTHVRSSEWCEMNPRTLFAGEDEHQVLVSPLGPRSAFLAGYPRMAELARDAPARSFVVVALEPSGAIAASALLDDQKRTVVGRHSECDLILSSPSVSLRHVAALLRSDDEAPALHVWDLATGSPFVTEDGATEHALVSTGPLYVAFDRYALWLVPAHDAGWSSAANAEEAFDALPPRTFVPREQDRSRKPSPAPEAPEGYRAAAKKRNHSGLATLVSYVEPPLELADDEPSAAIGVLSVATGSTQKRLMVSAERLARGILVGRYARCDVLALAEEARLSRVHALLVRLGEETWIIDTASTYGVERNAARIEASVVEHGDQMRLAGEVTMSWWVVPG